MLAFLVAFGVFAGIQTACSTRVLPFDPASYAPEQFSEVVRASARPGAEAGPGAAPAGMA